jgi:hypothetical protein
MIKRLVLSIALLCASAFGQGWTFKDSLYKVTPGISGTLRSCVWDQYGEAVNGAYVYAQDLAPTEMSGYHLHDTNVATRPNITFDNGLQHAGPVTTVGGCANFHIIIPNFAGQYMVQSYCTTCANEGTTTFYVQEVGTPYTAFPWGGWTGILPLVTYSDFALHGIYKYSGTSAAITKFEAIGSYYYLNVGWPLNVLKANWLAIVRISLPQGGWLDDIGPLRLSFWYSGNTDPHPYGTDADFVVPAGFVTQFKNAVGTAGCATYEYNQIGNDYSGLVWHVGCY